jgi:hypothetical protein
MANWTDQGHGMRRRTGAPSNHFESVGNMKSRKHQTSAEAMVSSGPQNARVSMGMSTFAVDPAATMNSVDELNPSQMRGTLIPKKSTQAADPTAGGKANHANVLYTERLGSSFRVKAVMGKQIDPAAGATMANARIVPSVQGRANPNFDAGIQASTL